MRGQPSGKTGLWQRQVWVWVKPGEFLIIVMSGPKNTQTRIDACCQAVIDSLEIIDPATAMKTRKENLLRGEKLLKGLTDKKLTGVFSRRRQWYLFRMKDKEVGYMTVSTSISHSGKKKGYMVNSFVKFSFPGGKVRVVNRSQFSTADRSLARWREKMLIGTGAKALKITEKGIKQGDLILCHRCRGVQERTYKKPLKPTSRGIYLPDALAMVLPQLVDLKKKTTYAFATYTSAANDFDMRTLTVVGPEKITIAGRQVEAIRTNERTAADEEPAKLYINSEGVLLRMETADGLIMETATKSAIIRRFPNDRDKIESFLSSH